MVFCKAERTCKLAFAMFFFISLTKITPMKLQYAQEFGNP
jgi:hypothetical protein